MADKDEKIVKKEEVKELKKEPKEEKKDNYKSFHRKSIRQIASESKKRLEKDLEDLPKEEIKEEPKKEVKEAPKEEIKEVLKEEPKIDVEKVATEAARKAAEEVRKDFEAKAQAILDKDKSLEEKQKELDALIPVWEKEKRLPKDWRESLSELTRINDLKIEQRLKAAREAQEKEESDRKAKESKSKEDQQKAYQDELTRLNKQVEEDLESLFQAGHIKRPADINKVDSEDAKEYKEFMEFGIKLNQELAKEKKPAVKSLYKLYLDHYKPFKDAQGKSKQPAGADAPISGATPVVTKREPEGYVYVRDHFRTFRQIARGENKK